MRHITSNWKIPFMMIISWNHFLCMYKCVVYVNLCECLHMCECLCAQVHLHVCTYLWVCVGVKLLLFLFTLHFIYWERTSCCTRILPIQFAQSSLPYFLSLKCTHWICLSFTSAWWIWTLDLIFIGQVLCPLSHLVSPRREIFKLLLLLNYFPNF